MDDITEIFLEQSLNDEYALPKALAHFIFREIIEDIHADNRISDAEMEQLNREACNRAGLFVSYIMNDPDMDTILKTESHERSPHGKKFRITTHPLHRLIRIEQQLVCFIAAAQSAEKDLHSAALAFVAVIKRIAGSLCFELFGPVPDCCIQLLRRHIGRDSPGCICRQHAGGCKAVQKVVDAVRLWQLLLMKPCREKHLQFFTVFRQGFSGAKLGRKDHLLFSGADIAGKIGSQSFNELRGIRHASLSGADPADIRRIKRDRLA